MTRSPGDARLPDLSPGGETDSDFVGNVRALMQHFRESYALDGRIDICGVAYRIREICEGREPMPEDFGRHEIRYGIKNAPDPRFAGLVRLMHSGSDHLILQAGSDRMDVGLIRTDEGWPDHRASVERAVIAGRCNKKPGAREAGRASGDNEEETGDAF